MTNQVPPQAIELEESILGAIMLERDAYGEASEIVGPDDFYDPVNVLIFKAIERLAKNSRPIDMKTVVHQLREDRKLDDVNGPATVAELTTKVNSAANIQYHATVVKQMSMLRGVIQLTADINQRAYQLENVDGLLEELETASNTISSSIIKGDAVRVDKLIIEAKDQLEARHKARSENGVVGVPTGLWSLDSKLGGLKPTDLIIVAARPAMGKTAFVTNIMRNADCSVLMLSLEMSNIQITNRLLSGELSVNNSVFNTGWYQDDVIERILLETDDLMKSEIYIDDTPALSLHDIKIKTRKAKKKHDIKLLVVDYIQLASDRAKGQNREQEIAAISRGLKAIAKELDITVIALSQLSRAVEQRADKKPMLSDLRESGSIEQDADIVMFLYRPEYYGITEVDGVDLTGKGAVIVAKHRNGNTGEVWLNFKGEYTRWEE